MSLINAMLLQEYSEEKQMIVKKIIEPIIKNIANTKNTIIDLGAGVGTIEMQILKEIPRTTSTQLIINDCDENMLGTALARIKKEAREKAFKKVRVRGICGDLTKVVFLCKQQANAVIFSMVLHELASLGGMQKSRRGLKRIYDLLSDGGMLSLCDFADVSPGKNVDFRSIKFATVEQQMQFRKQCEERYRYALKKKPDFSIGYSLYKEKQHIPASIVIDALYGMFAGVPTGHLHTALFTVKDILGLLENSGFEIIKTTEFKCKKDMVYLAKKTGIVNAEEIVALLPPEYIVILSRKSAR
jgi:ubiquinone/menaquinone biosynthesis C-methylase UbiE